MPGFITHLCFGQQAVSQIDNSAVRKNIKLHASSYGLGLQGPDIFFYFVPAYFSKKNIGSRMHSENVMLFFEALADARDSFKLQEDRDICDAYICGFMGHYTLDIWCHPYIYYRTNHFKAVEQRGGAFDFGNHVSLETDIDHVMLREFKGLRPTKFDYAAAVRPSDHESDVIATLLSYSINSTFSGVSLSKPFIKNAIRNFAVLNHAMCDPTGFKKHVVRRIEQVFFGCATISAMIPSDSKMKFKDPCNKKHHHWSNPWNEESESCQSMFDLFSEATPEFLEKIDLYSKSTVKNIEKEDKLHYRNQLLSLLSDLSYLSGLPLE